MRWCMVARIPRPRMAAPRPSEARPFSGSRARSAIRLSLRDAAGGAEEDANPLGIWRMIDGQMTREANAPALASRAS